MLGQVSGPANHTPALLPSSWTPPKPGLPPPSFHPLTLAAASSPALEVFKANTCCLPILHQELGKDTSPP